MAKRQEDEMVKRHNDGKEESPCHEPQIIGKNNIINGNLKMNCRISIYIYKVAH